MVGLFVSDKQDQLQVFIKKGAEFEFEDEVEGFWSKLISLPCRIATSTKYIQYDLIATFNPASRNMGFRHSRGGFWTGVHDQVAPKIGSRYFVSSQMEGTPSGYHVDLQSWEWGKNPKLRFTMDTSFSGLRKDVWSTVVARPFFQNGEEEVVLELTLFGRTAQGGRELINTVKVSFVRNDEFGEGDDNNLLFLHDFGAFHLNGLGNSVHPKQLYSCNAIKRCILEDFRGKESISLGYIGPDTTENLRSLMRMLSVDEELKDLNINLHVFYHPSWDIPTAIHNFETTSYPLTEGPIQPILWNAAEVGTKKPEHLDLLLATYVGPWAVSPNDEESEEQYYNLLNTLLSPKTQFITIDPSSSKCSVVSHAPSANHDFTLTKWYKKRLGLHDETLPWNAKNADGDQATVVCRKWKRGASS